MDFQEWFVSQETCLLYLTRLRWPEGYRCPKCDSTECFYIKTRGLYQCKGCKHQASATSGTIFDKTRVPLPKWFHMIFLLGRHRGGMSVVKMASQLRLGYKTAWLMSAKIRRALLGREDLLQVENFDLAAFERILEACLATESATFSDLKRDRGRNITDSAVQNQ
jgi:transposase-like protein